MLSVLAGDWPAFERHVGQLAPLHRAAAGGSGEAPGAGSMRLHVQGLALMHLLADARLGDFHCAAEALSPGEREVPYVAFPLRLEALLMEGGYNQVRWGLVRGALPQWRSGFTPFPSLPPQILESGPSQPSPLYAPFLAKLAHTVRDDVADCAQAAYARLAVSEAARMLKLDVPPGGSPGDAVARYAAGRGLDWVLEGGDVRFAAPEKPRPSVDASALMEHALQYANDLERIV